MADNVTLNSGSGGAVIKTDDDGTAHWQYTKLAYGADNTQTRVTASNGLPTSVLGAVDSNNSSTSTLLTDAVFTGTGTDVTHHRNVIVSAFSDVASATDGLAIQFSSDNSNWDTEITFTISAGVGESHAVPVQAQYMRVVYTNGGTGQASFRLQTILSPVDVTGEVAPLNATLKDEDQAMLSRSVIAAYNGTSYSNISATAGGNLKVSLQEASDGLDIGAGNAGGETIRVSIASDDVNLSTIAGAVHNEDSAHTTADPGIQILGVRQDTQSDFGADGDYVPLSIDADGAVRVNAINAGGTSNVDTAAGGTDEGAVMLAVRDDALTTLTPIDGDYAPLRLTSTGAMWSEDVNSSAILADTANMDTNLGTVAGAVSGSEMQVDVVASLPAGTNAIGKLAANSGVDIGDVDVTSISAGSNLIGDVGLSGARTSGGTSIFRSLDLDESEEEIKSTAGQVYWIHAMNLTASALYLKLYNATAANVTVGTTTPVLTFPLATQGDTNGAGFTLAIPNGIAFGTAITAAVTTGVADNDTTGPAANGCVVNIGYA